MREATRSLPLPADHRAQRGAHGLFSIDDRYFRTIALLPAAGARGFETGNFGLVTLYHPPVLQYVYGAPVALGDFNLVYPFFISYFSEYAGPEEYRYETLVDSSLDWGQGLLALRDYMAEEGVETVYLSYFGSAVPEAYGIRYVPLPSFFTLQLTYDMDPGVTPALAAISATNLAGNYLVGDPFARFRDVRPIAVLAGSIFIFEVGR